MSRQTVVFTDRARANRVAVCVCTRQRPRMLRACLGSLDALIIDPTILPFFVVVENDWSATCQSVVQEFGKNSRYPFVYVQERVQGIARARNAAVEKALSLGAEWIVFIDDDETAEPDWLIALMAPEYLETPILSGRVNYVYPNPAPFWAPLPGRARHRKHREGEPLKMAATNNIRFDSLVFLTGFRFDATIGTMGGEDTDLTGRAHRAGYDIKRTMKAVTHEIVHAERLTYGAQVYRSYWNEVGNIRLDKRLDGALKTAITKTHTIFTDAIFGAVELLASPLFLVTGLRRFKRRALKGGKKIGKAAGRFAGIVGIMPCPYKNIAGR